MRLVLLGLALAGTGGTCFGVGPFIIGVRGGVPLNDIINTVENGQGVKAATENYVVGPTVGLKLPLGFSATVDALFSRLSVGVNQPAPGSGTVKFHANSWEFPFMLRFTLPTGAIAPFLGAGFSVRHLSNIGDIGPFITGSSQGNVVNKNNTVGFVAAGGLRFKAGPVNFSPEIRYTHWGSNNISDAFRSVLKTNSNEAQILFGLTF